MIGCAHLPAPGDVAQVTPGGGGRRLRRVTSPSSGPPSPRRRPKAPLQPAAAALGAARWARSRGRPMAESEWDWFQREERIGHISDIRVQNLQVERVRTQKRTFTRWINFHLERCKPPLEVKDLFRDMQDGKILMALLEVMSGHRLMHHYKQSMHRIFRLNNIARALKFLEDGYVKLVSIDAPEIADGNPSMILGLIWNIILHFQIKEAAGHLKIFSPTSSLSSLHNGSESDLTALPSSPSETAPMAPYKVQRKVIKAMLKWVQRRTAKYGVAIQDFGSSWRSGIAFLALIKAIEPSLVNMEIAMERPSRVNLEDAFKIAEDCLEIPPLLEPEDVDVERPEEQSITTYVSQFLKHFPEIDENDLADETTEHPSENSVDASSRLGVEDSYKTQGRELRNVLNEDQSATEGPVDSLLKEEVIDIHPLDGDHSLVIKDGGSAERETNHTSSSDLPNPDNSKISLHLDSESSSRDLHSRTLQPAPDTTERVEEIYVLLQPVRRKSSKGEKIFVLEKEPSSPASDYGSPLSANVFTAVPDVETAQPSEKGSCESSLEISSEAMHSFNSSNSQGQSLHSVDCQTEASMPARNRTVSESCTQTDEKPLPQQNELLPLAIDPEEKVSVIPLKLVYYPHYDVPVSEMIEAFSVTGTSPNEFIPRIQPDKELSPLTADEAYQSCSDLSATWSLRELSPTFSEYTLCTPDSDQVDTLNNPSHPEAGEIIQPSYSFQGTETSKFMPEAKTCAPSEDTVVSHVKLPVLEGVNGHWEEKSSEPKDGDLQVSEREGQEERCESPEEVGGQPWNLQTMSSGAKEIGEDAESWCSDTELSAGASLQRHAVLQSTVISSSTAIRNVEDVRNGNSCDTEGPDQELSPKVVDEQSLSPGQQHVSKQGHMKSLLEPRKLFQDEFFHDADLTTTAGIQEGQHKQVSDSPLLLNEPKITEQTCLHTRSALQSYNPIELTFGSHGASISNNDEVSSGPTVHPQLPYLIILLWMAIYWMIILLHLDMESLGQFTFS